MRTLRTRLALPLVAATAFGTLGVLSLGGSASAGTDPAAAPPTVTAADPTYLVAALNGRNEVPGAAGSPAAGDPDGQAVEVLKIQGNQVAFAIKWTGITAPVAGHIHTGAAGTAGAVVVPFFGAGLTAGLTAVVGAATVTDPAVLDAILANPGAFYVNLHTAEFPAGAVRGQLHKATHPVDLNSFLRGGPLTALLDGTQEVPAGGDPDGHAAAFVRASYGQVEFAFAWSGIGAPVAGHIHQGSSGVGGPVVVPFFAAPTGLPATISGVAGVVTGVAPDLIGQISRDPAAFYVNLHTTEFPAGAVRGQLFGSGSAAGPFNSSSFVASVVQGRQIYACTAQADGTFAYTQLNVSARLQTGIRHSFVADVTGPPQWVSRDGSSVTGTVLTRLPNGAGNIAELDLDLTQTGAKTGQLAGALEAERLNTVGGVAPAGACDATAHPTAEVDYQADYLFLIK
ncbi:MAG: hypothetical protein QOE03_1877 [Micromonosporaceae bacterium]|nr:hypothetical protein [Micromonosporaceae bacterium]